MDAKQEMSAADLASILGMPTPTADQAAVAEYPFRVQVDGEWKAAPLLVVAGAGSGKTKTLSLRAAYVANRDKVDGQNILGLTFTRKAAAELAENLTSSLEGLSRAEAMAQQRPVEPFSFLLNSPEATTYNAFALSVVQEFGASVGITPSVEHMGEAASWQLMSEVVALWPGEIHGDSAESTVVDRALSLREDIANQAMTVKEAEEEITALRDKFLALQAEKPSSFTKDFRAALEGLNQRLDLLEMIGEFEQRKAATGKMDYADQVLAAIRIVEESEQARQALRDRHKLVFLDEFQDTSVAQLRFLSALFGDHPVTAVGDPNQAIYGWRGASAGSLLDFHPKFTREKGVPRATKSLSVAWRSEKNILDVANEIAEPLRSEEDGGTVLTLEPRPGAGDGDVIATYPMTERESIDGIVSYVADVRSRGGVDGEGRPPSVAVLARTNRPLLSIVEALREAQIPAQLVGGDSLLRHPAVIDLRAALHITWDIGRSSALMRLLGNLDLGAADLQALGLYSRKLSRELDPGGETPRILLEAVEAVREGKPVRGLSSEGAARVGRLGDQLAEMRRGTSGSLVAQVGNARDILGLELDGLADPSGGDTADVLDLFTGVVAEYEGSADRPTMGGFLTWLEVAEKKEQGIRVPSVNLDPQAVQVLTIHSAKGLEWDAVVVAEMSASRFPSSDARSYRVISKDPKVVGPPLSPAPASEWWTNTGQLPYPCRKDREHLPDPDIWDANTGGGGRYALFREGVGEYKENEERRLAYVAVTRARRDLLLTGSWFSTAKSPRFPSIFLQEALETKTSGGGDAVQADLTDLPPEDEWESKREVPRPAEFPREPGLTRRQTRQAALRVLEEMGASKKGKRERERALQVIEGSHPEQGARLAEELRLLLNKRDAEVEAEDLDSLSPQEIFDKAARSRVLSVTEIADFVSDPEKGAEELTRPVPSRPVSDALIGDAFHQWAEQYLGRLSVSGAELDPEEIQAGVGLGDDQRKQVGELAAAFKRGGVPQGWRVIGVEVPFLISAGTQPVRGRVDAVFEDEAGSTHLVDWKTRRHPVRKVSPKTVAYYQKQLELYVEAWKSGGTTVDTQEVDARIVFVSPEGTQTLTYADLEAAAGLGEGITVG